MRLRMLFVGLMLALVIGLPFAGAPASAEDKIVLGIMGDFTGPTAAGESLAYGRRDYVNWINSKGGVAGHKIQDIFIDGKGTAQTELPVFKQMVERGAVAILMWSTSGGLAMRDLVNKLHKIPVMMPGQSMELVDPVNYPYMFILGPTYEDQIKILLDYAKATGAKTVAFLNDDTGFGKSGIDNIMKMKYAECIGLTVLGRIEFPSQAPDLTTEMARLKSLDPDFAYFHGPITPAIRIAQASHAVGVRTLRAGYFGTAVPAMAGLGAAAEKWTAPRLYVDFAGDAPVLREIAEYEKVREVPAKHKIMNYVQGWTEARVMVEGIRRAIEKNGGKIPTPIATFRQMVRDEIHGLKNFDLAGATAQIVDYANHQGNGKARLVQDKGGNFTDITGYEAPKGKCQ
jgi:branched-chain amino acid transport system substrate-binding protein